MFVKVPVPTPKVFAFMMVSFCDKIHEKILKNLTKFYAFFAHWMLVGHKSWVTNTQVHGWYVNPPFWPGVDRLRL